MTAPLTVDVSFLSGLAQQLRVDSTRCSTAAGSGHPTSAMSAADLMAVLLARHLRYDWDNPGERGNDHLIFSKGHASPLLYAMFKAAGVAYRRRAEAFGCTAVVIDGHDITQIDQALAMARDAERPTVVLARTVKGKGFAEIEDKNGWHGRPLPADIISGANIMLCGSHAGTEIGPGGPSQMALEDLAAMRAIHGSTVLYPADATAAAALTADMADTPGIVYLRTTRGAWPVLYPAGEAFPVGGSKVLRAGPGDQVTLAGAGVTVHQCLRAAGELAADGIAARVIDLYSVKPVDHATLADAAADTNGRLVIAEDHYPQGGLGAAVLEALAGTGLPLRVRQCAVGGLPGSGTPDELMEAAGISASRIAAARELVKD